MINPDLEKMLRAAEEIDPVDLMTILALLTAQNIYYNVDEQKRPKALRMYDNAIRSLLRTFEDQDEQTQH